MSVGYEIMISKQPSLLLIGPTPPPFHGVAVAIQTLLQSDLVRRFPAKHLELADRRGIQHVNKPDFHDVLLFVRQWLKLVGMLITIRPTVSYLVLSQSTIGFLRDSLLIWPAYLGRSHIVVHLHGGNFREWLLGRSWLMKTYVKTVLRRVTRAIVLGESLRAQFKGLIAEDRIAVVPNGIDWSGSDRDRNVPRSQGRCRILHLSTLSHLKGALVLLQAIPLVVQQRKDVEFMLAGPWSHEEDRQWAEDFIHQHKLETYVSFSGQVDAAEKKLCLTLPIFSFFLECSRKVNHWL